MPKPKAYDESKVEHFWRSEGWDKNLPSPGFITDFVLHTRGIETPTMLSTWTAIFLISSVLGREGYLQWFPRPLYPNLFIFFVGPPKICAKSTAAGIGEKILQTFHESLPPQVAALKEQNLSLSKATPESLTILLHPEERPVVDAVHKKVYQVDRGSRLTLIVDELATFLGKQQYNTGLIDRLTHLYDCKDYDTEVTVARGKIEFRNVYMTFLGAATPEHLSGSIPQEAFGGGFMSRVILVYHPGSVRDFPIPRMVLGGPSLDELKKRLAWIALNALGEYTLAPDALEYYERWYMGFKDFLRKHQADKDIAMHHRMDTHLLKLALIIRAQRYEEGREITLQDFLEAKSILDNTLQGANIPVQDVGASQWTKAYNRIRDIIKAEDTKRRDLLRKMSPYGVRAQDVNEILKNLHEEGLIAITLDNMTHNTVSKNGNETYEYIGAQK